jgi:hypothetical protein
MMTQTAILHGYEPRDLWNLDGSILRMLGNALPDGAPMTSTCRTALDLLETDSLSGLPDYQTSALIEMARNAPEHLLGGARRQSFEKIAAMLEVFIKTANTFPTEYGAIDPWRRVLREHVDVIRTIGAAQSGFAGLDRAWQRFVLDVPSLWD